MSDQWPMGRTPIQSEPPHAPHPPGPNAINRENWRRGGRGKKGRYTKGDVEGHTFHGNQYTGGIGGGEHEGDDPQVLTVLAGGKAKYPALLRTADGRPILLSARDITQGLLNGGTIREGESPPKLLVNTLTHFDEKVDATLGKIVGEKNLDEHGISSIGDNFGKIADSVLQRYKDDPSLINGDKFYEQWNYSSRILANETGFDQDRMIAALASMSPGKNAFQNLRETSDLSRIMGMNDQRGPQLSELGDFRQRIQDEADAYRAKADNEDLSGVQRQKADASATDLETGLRLMDSGEATHMNDLPGVVAARFASDYRQVNPQGDPPLHEWAPEDYHLNPKAGFGAAKGWWSYGRSVDVLRGFSVDDTGRPPYAITDALDIKTGSFYNNIADPHDEQGAHSVTIDYHAVAQATRTIGMNEYSNWESSPTVAGVPIGVRAHVADGIRDLVPRFAAALHEPDLSPSRAQEILWAEGNRIEGSRTYSDGRPYDYLNISKLWGKGKQ